ncbi:MAG TPA: phosphatidylserine decarboxylase family protein [Bacteroidia bacterium]|nr:phosphatidylserine decarboxylase family protein [Bacteroidia bacterium]
MTIHKEGYPTIGLGLVFSAILIGIAHYFFPEFIIAKIFAYTLGAFVMIVVLQFFRSPGRNWTKNDKAIICPADGKVVVIEETSETEFFQDKRIQISVFMSPINVHVNRYPLSGIVKYAKYHPGKYLVAWHPKSSTENERTTVVVERKDGTQVLFRQIAGALARRIVMYSKEGDVAGQTDQFGFIKFGSRVDVFLPIGTKINVKLDEVVKGGITVLAEI